MTRLWMLTIKKHLLIYSCLCEYIHTCCLVAVLCPTLLWPHGLKAPLVYEISQARILDWVAISFSRESSRPRNRTCVSCIDRQILYHWATREAHIYLLTYNWYIICCTYSEKAVAPHSSTLAWKILWTEEPGRLQSMRSVRVRHDWATSLTFHFHALEKEMATHSSVLAWRIPGTAEPGGLPSMGSHRVGHDWSDLAAACSTY